MKNDDISPAFLPQGEAKASSKTTLARTHARSRARRRHPKYSINAEERAQFLRFAFTLTHTRWGGGEKRLIHSLLSSAEPRDRTHGAAGHIILRIPR